MREPSADGRGRGRHLPLGSRSRRDASGQPWARRAPPARQPLTTGRERTPVGAVGTSRVGSRSPRGASGQPWAGRRVSPSTGPARQEAHAEETAVGAGAQSLAGRNRSLMHCRTAKEIRPVAWGGAGRVGPSSLTAGWGLSKRSLCRVRHDLAQRRPLQQGVERRAQRLSPVASGILDLGRHLMVDDPADDPVASPSGEAAGSASSARWPGSPVPGPRSAAPCRRRGETGSRASSGLEDLERLLDAIGRRSRRR